MKLFDLDGPVQRYGSIIFDLMVLTFIWFFITLFSFGLLGGIATTAFYHAVYHSVLDSSGSSLGLFFKTFRRKFIVATATYLTVIIALSISILCAYWVYTGIITIFWLLPVYLFLTLELLFVLTYLFPMLAHTSYKYKDVLKMSFLVAGRHLPTTILVSALTLGGIFFGFVLMQGLVQLFPFFLVYTPLSIMATSYLVTKRLLSKYPFYEDLV